jgi:hypothetical protein
MFEVFLMGLKRMIVVFGMFLMIVPALAANDDLETVEAPALGERVATYLQTMVTAVSQTMAIKPSSNPSLNQEAYRATVTYNFALEAIDVSLVGTLTDKKKVKDIIEFTQKLLLGFNKKLDYNFGITLEDQDINVEYQNVLENRIILQYQGGFYSVPDSKKNPD